MSDKIRKLLNPWNIAVVTLVVGLVLGYQVNDVMTSGVITRLQGEVGDQSTQITTMQQQLDELLDSYEETSENLSRVTRLYDELRANSIQRYMYDDLLEDYETAAEDLKDYKDRAKDLEDENEQLVESYVTLWNKYSDVRILSWTYFVANGLTVNLTTTKNVYDATNNIAGIISIHYLDGQPFNGSFKLILRSDFYTSGTSSNEIAVYGEADYLFRNPFIFGTGSYSLSVSSIWDADGKLIVGSSEVRDYYIQIQYG
ncbi:hypothetical protein JXL21_06485 [Candidatus Bathyarchaeota archaeon]|nr:hypothetical protein [Candidatus Bathyarchaeota archaeon]